MSERKQCYIVRCNVIKCRCQLTDVIAIFTARNILSSCEDLVLDQGFALTATVELADLGAVIEELMEVKAEKISASLDELFVQ